MNRLLFRHLLLPSLEEFEGLKLTNEILNLNLDEIPIGEMIRVPILVLFYAWNHQSTISKALD